MSSKETHLNEAEVQLKAGNTASDGLKGDVGQAQTESRNRFHQLVQNFSASEAEAVQYLDALKQADSVGREKYEKQLDEMMVTLQKEIDELKIAAQNVANESIGWAEGLAEEDEVKSIGWAEGLAKKDIVESIGWAEGQAEEDVVRSKGWAEGYDKKS